MEMDLAVAKSLDYFFPETSLPKKKLLAVVGIYTGFGGKLTRNAFRGSWMPKGFTFVFFLF